MTEEFKVEFLPFHAINEFMRPDFRLTVVRSALSALNTLSQNLRAPVDRLTKQVVKVPGFRHSEKAPTPVKVLPMAKAFESNPGLVAAILAAWAEAHADLRQQIFTVLEKRGWYLFPGELESPVDFPSLKTEKDWGVLPIQADRTRLPGFLIYWPKTETFENLYQTFAELYPSAQGSLDEVSLMAVWLALRLPYQVVEREENAPVEPSSQSEIPSTEEH